MTSFLSNLGSTVGKGVSDLGKGVGKGVGDVGKGVGQGVSYVASQGARGQPDTTQDTTQVPQPSPGPATRSSAEGSQTLFGSLGKGITDAGRQGTNLLGQGFSSGFEIAGHLSKNTLDLQKNVAASIGSIGGTAIDAVVTAASATTGAVFNPVANGLKAIEGLEGLGEGVDQINGLSTKALQGLASATKDALAVAGKPPTFFDPDADGIVKFADTQKGFVLLGLEEKYAKIAAYALHTTFRQSSFSTSNSWDPRASALNSEMPIHVDKMSQTRWGKNWGNFERLDWVSDTDVETFFGLRPREKWSEYYTDIKSYFGTALLIFEWGTTWPYAFGPAFDATSSVTRQLGTIMRTVILPTIFKSRENAKKGDLNRQEEEKQSDKQ
ncbi:hypothetical protein BDZ89DRAFT_1219708 [Hymenopellis radicata]|nr:hypothetical protein BDZ89DRAFT_1219708 [Hymenopellis radicata]